MLSCPQPDPNRLANWVDQCSARVLLLGSFGGEEARFSFRLVFTYVPRRALGRASGVGSPPGGAGSPTHTGGEPWGDCNLPHIMRVRARVCRDSSRHVSADTRPETPRVTL